MLTAVLSCTGSRQLASSLSTLINFDQPWSTFRFRSILNYLKSSKEISRQLLNALLCVSASSDFDPDLIFEKYQNKDLFPDWIDEKHKKIIQRIWIRSFN